MSQSNSIPVGKFRNQIRRCEDRLSIHWGSCVGDAEKIDWFGAAFTSFQELSEMNCQRATEQDINDSERVQDRFSSHVAEHFDLWQRARVKYQEDFDPQTAIDEIEKMNSEVSKADHEIKLYRSALSHFGDKASDFKVEDWKRRLSQATERKESLTSNISDLIARTELLLKRLSENCNG